MACLLARECSVAQGLGAGRCWGRRGAGMGGGGCAVRFYKYYSRCLRERVKMKRKEEKRGGEALMAK